MTITTLLKFLLGNRTAILRIASDRRALLVGALLVLSAGFAREYDGEDLLAEPWHLLIPFAASLALALCLFVLVLPAFEEDEPRPPFWRGLASFVALFWMTAPLALLYAIPYERFLAPGHAVAANLWTLAAVSAWRVLLMSRALSVVTGRGMFPSFLLVMLLSDAAAQLALTFVPLPLFQIMGGVRLTEGENALLGTAILVRLIGLPALVILLIAGMAVLARRTMRWQVPPTAAHPRGNTLLYAGIAMLLGWALVLPITQPEQRLRRQVDRDLKSGRIPEALAEMASHPRHDFPPHWDPPPRPGYGETTPPLLEIVRYIVDNPQADWVEEVFAEKFARQYVGYYRYYGEEESEQWPEIREIIRRLRNGELERRFANEIASVQKRIEAERERSTTVPATMP